MNNFYEHIPGKYVKPVNGVLTHNNTKIIIQVLKCTSDNVVYMFLK